MNLESDAHPKVWCLDNDDMAIDVSRHLLDSLEEEDITAHERCGNRTPPVKSAHMLIYIHLVSCLVVSVWFEQFEVDDSTTFIHFTTLVMCDVASPQVATSGVGYITYKINTLDARYQIHRQELNTRYSSLKWICPRAFSLDGWVSFNP